MCMHGGIVGLCLYPVVYKLNYYSIIYYIYIYILRSEIFNVQIKKSLERCFILKHGHDSSYFVQTSNFSTVVSSVLRNVLS